MSVFLQDTNLLAILAILLHWGLVLAFMLRIILRRRPMAVLLAWLALLFSVPILGVLIYLFVGESRISERHLKHARQVHSRFEGWKQSLREKAWVDWQRLNIEVMPLQKAAETVVGIPAMPGNRLQLLHHYQTIFKALIEDVNQCRKSCHFEFYIWYPGGRADDLLEAVIRAAGRGVDCRVLLDAVGSKQLIKSKQYKQLENAGVKLGVALPVSLFSTFFSRADLRNHRKMVVIDSRVAYTGSQNIVDPRLFKQNEGVGQWVDAMLRITGPGVEAMQGQFFHDWEVVTLDSGDISRPADHVLSVPPAGNVPVQLVPSGPAPKPLAILQMLLATIYAARRELIITTPYFVPDESVANALISAAHSGVDVTLIIPAKNNFKLVYYASQAMFGDLLSEGVKIATYKGGLLHTKSITVDGEFSLFGSVNMDMRSLWLNFELSLFIYDEEFTRQIRQLQHSYLDDVTFLSAKDWEQRPRWRRVLENAAYLTAPVL